jgi:hypothetical protein
LGAALTLWLLIAALPAGAVERIRITAAQVTIEGATLEGIDATLALQPSEQATLTLTVDRTQLPESLASQTGPIGLLKLHCGDLVIREPRIACDALTTAIDVPQWLPIQFDGSFEMHTDSGNLHLTGAGPELAGQRLDIDITQAADDIAVALRLPTTSLSTLLPLLARWVDLPTDTNPTGNAVLAVDFSTGPHHSRATLDIELSDVDFQNPEATWIGEHLALNLSADVDLSQQPLTWQTRLSGDTGQFLGGLVLLDLGHNPLAIEAHGTFDGQVLAITQWESHQQNLARMQGAAELRLNPFSLSHARVELEALQFPDAYASYLQIVLATTPFNQLTTSGHLSGALTIRDDTPIAADLQVHDLAFNDDSRHLNVTGVDADLHWTADEIGPPRPSWRKWDSARGWGVDGARSRVDFLAHQNDFQLLQPARLPLFDGALVIQRLAVQNAGTPQLAGEFAAMIEPISLQPVSRALGLPEFSGTLAGTIPGLRYHDQTLELEGVIAAQVFDGTIVARNLRIGEPLSRFPQLRADLLARSVDLQRLTEVFDFGSITGRIDVDLTGLQTYGNRATAFDFSLRNTPTDRTKRRISQRAVENLSNMGGGGGVGAALQKGALKFFDTFIYDRIGLSCQLRNDVCLMNGVGAVRNDGFYIVRGWGLPRIDIIGNQRRVDWPRLISQLGQALSNSGGFVVN